MARAFATMAILWAAALTVGQAVLRMARLPVSTPVAPAGR